jgi:hypothetical protein
MVSATQKAKTMHITVEKMSELLRVYPRTLMEALYGNRFKRFPLDARVEPAIIAECVRCTERDIWDLLAAKHDLLNEAESAASIGVSTKIFSQRMYAPFCVILVSKRYSKQDLAMQHQIRFGKAPE